MLEHIGNKTIIYDCNVGHWSLDNIVVTDIYTNTDNDGSDSNDCNDPSHHTFAWLMSRSGQDFNLVHHFVSLTICKVIHWLDQKTIVFNISCQIVKIKLFKLYC